MNSVMKYEFKGTPGPWHIYKTPDGKIDPHPGIESEDGSIIVYGNNDEYFGVRGHTPEEKIANAHLIAASSLLLSALIKAVEFEAYDQSVIAHEANDVPDWYKEAKSAIEAALNLKTVEK